jgi:NADH:ubiquinone oxidoreductase subunit 6 (subunit J)
MSHTERHSTSIVYKDKFRAFSGALLGVVFGACIINVGMNNSFSRDWSNVPTYIIYFSIGLNLIIYLIAVIISKSSVEISNVNTRLTNDLNRIRNINVENSMSIYSLYGQEFDRTMRSELSYQSKRRGLIIPDNLFNGKFEPEILMLKTQCLSTHYMVKSLIELCVQNYPTSPREEVLSFLIIYLMVNLNQRKNRMNITESTLLIFNGAILVLFSMYYVNVKYIPKRIRKGRFTLKTFLISVALIALLCFVLPIEVSTALISISLCLEIYSLTDLISYTKNYLAKENTKLRLILERNQAKNKSLSKYIK